MTLTPLTAEQILTLPAGLALDAAVAEYVMGWTRYKEPPSPSDNRAIGGVLYCPPDYPWDCTMNVVPAYSTLIAAAWQMGEEVERQGLKLKYGDALAGIIAEATYRMQPFDFAHASPVDRCRAALLAVA